MALKTAQARQLWRTLLLRWVGILLAWTAVFAGAALLLETFVFPPLGEALANATSRWEILDQDQYRNAAESIGYSFISSPDRAMRFQAIPGADETVSFRDLYVYEQVRRLKLPIACAVYLAGLLGGTVFMLRRSVGSFDALASAVTGLVSNRTASFDLPDDLPIVRAELQQLQAQAIADELASVEAERRKNEMVAYLAHDIRSPLTSVTGYLELLKDSPDMPEETRARYADIAFSKACRMEGLVNEFFEITRYNVARMPIEREWLDAALFCQQVAEGFEVQAASRGLTLRVDAPEGLEFWGDPDKLSRALGNVIRNAIAFADVGTTVLVTAQAVAAPCEGAPEPPDVLPAAAVAAAPSGQAVAAGGSSAARDALAPPSAAGAVPAAPVAVAAPAAFVRITVTDRGKEISKLHLQSIFEKFFREDSARGQGNGGAGLGLAIAKEIVEAHEGTIAAASEGGVTTFAICLPLR